MMKKLMIALVLTSGAVYSCSRNIAQSQVPSVVLNTFSQHFPDAKDVEWEKKADYYEVEFGIGQADHEAWIDASGRMTRHAYDIPLAEIPQEVKSTLQKHYSSYTVMDVDKIEEGSVITYEVETENNGVETIMMIAADGTVIGTYQETD